MSSANLKLDIAELLRELVALTAQARLGIFRKALTSLEDAAD
ncbi:MAG: hypothetical protein ABW006_02095 [Hyphomicrobium sp.]